MNIYIIIILIIFILSNNKKNNNKKIIKKKDINKYFNFIDNNNDKFLTIKELLKNLDTDGRQISTEIFLASVIDYDIKNNTSILKDNMISVNELNKIHESNLKLDLFDESKLDNNNNFLPKNDYAKSLLLKAKDIIKKNN